MTTKIQVLHLIGATCAGKSTILRELATRAPDRVGTVEVGKILRAKYPPEHFLGQAAPKHTQEEAWELYTQGVRERIDEGKTLIVVDGQPRDEDQIEQVLLDPFSDIEGVSYEFLLVHAAEATRVKRARERDTTDASLKLTMDRMTNDYRNCYTVMRKLATEGVEFDQVDTTMWDEEPNEEVYSLLLGDKESPHGD